VVAGLIAGAIVLFIILMASSGGGAGQAAASHSPTQSQAGFFTRLETLAGQGTGSFVHTQQAALNGAIDRTLAYTPYVRIAGAQHRELALTFDDGPGPYTPQVIGVLQRYKVPATFFEVGVLEQYFHVSTTAIVAAGDVIGDHTFDHPPMSELSAADQQSQLLEQTSTIGKYGAPFPRLFRPPYGLWNSTTLSLLHQYRMLMVLWTVDTNDYTLPGVPAIVHSAVSGARPGAIILMHDAGGNRQETVDALPTIIKDLRARGYRLVTVPQLLLDNPAPANQDIGAVIGGSAG
jgi:peptidoglycan/xylan/chitin deacetylase (PgdA/CDA1 family)